MDKRADVSAFGCIVFEMLTATRAFDGPTTTDAVVAVLEREPDWDSLPAATPLRVRPNASPRRHKGSAPASVWDVFEPRLRQTRVLVVSRSLIKAKAQQTISLDPERCQRSLARRAQR